MRALAPFALLLLTVACKPAGGPAPAPSASAAASAAPVAVASAAASASAGTARVVSESSASYTFAYAYPAPAAAIPALKSWLDADLAKARKEVASEAQEGKKDAAEAGYPFNPHSSETKWQVVTDLPGWLSLSALTSGYSGGAHGNYGFVALLWDKGANQQREVTSLFTAKAALAQALKGPFCAELNRQRAKKRGAPIDPASTDEFDKCIDPTGSTLILGSSDHQHFDRIGVLIGPYEAGSYAEGSYEVTLPVTPAVLATVKPQFKAAFALKR
ncbi:MAG: DUF4163 domain-containing protein [Proteobacteria bacterium]|nr:DUF4163 domain-containing protein [Pseudomonadota bacterium]